MVPRGYDPGRPTGYTNNRPNYSDLLDEAVRGCMYVDLNERWNSYQLLKHLREAYPRACGNMGPDIELILPRRSA
jgi:hypothetical protein